MSKVEGTRYELNASPLYGLPSHRALAELLGWRGSVSSFKSFVRRRDNYRVYPSRTKWGKVRIIEEPLPGLKSIQRRFLQILSRIHVPRYLHSATLRRSYLSNSDTHRRAVGSTVTMDIDSFYHAVSMDRVSMIMEQNFCQPKDVAETIAHLLCCDGHLATGSPASPLASFWINREIFDKIYSRARRRESIFTLYIDDMAITGNTIGHSEIRWVEKELRTVGLSLKRSKSRVFRAKKAKLVTGRSFKNGVSKAPNIQHQRMKIVQGRCFRDPKDISNHRTLIGLMNHIALLDPVRKSEYSSKTKILRSKQVLGVRVTKTNS